MTAFLISAGVLIAGALAVVLRPLLRRRIAAADPGAGASTNAAVYRAQLSELDADLQAGTIDRAQWSASRAEIERRVLDEAGPAEAAPIARSSRFSAFAVGLALPVAAIALYAILGNPQAIFPGAGTDSAEAHAVTPEQIEGMVGRLAARLEQKPDDAEGWTMLGRSYAVLGRYAESANAYSKAEKLSPRDAQLLADYADVLAMARGRKLVGEPEALIARALAVDPGNVKALALSGSVAFERSDFARAIDDWQRALALVPADSDFAGSVRGSIEEARTRLIETGGRPPAARAPGALAAAKADGAFLEGRVSLASTPAAARVEPEDFVYVFARAAQGPRMPLAVLRRQVKDLPFDFRLDDSMAMAPSLKLSSFDKVVVVARISRSGLANPEKGDLEGATAAITPRTKGIRLRIDRPVK